LLALGLRTPPARWRLIDRPAVRKWSDFDDRHGKNCILLQASLPVRLNMVDQNNGQALSQAQDARPRYTDNDDCYVNGQKSTAR
jgi:hypothetical protein